VPQLADLFKAHIISDLELEKGIHERTQPTTRMQGVARLRKEAVLGWVQSTARVTIVATSARGLKGQDAAPGRKSNYFQSFSTAKAKSVVPRRANRAIIAATAVLAPTHPRYHSYYLILALDTPHECFC
jgi:hypothetical protein